MTPEQIAEHKEQSRVKWEAIVKLIKKRKNIEHVRFGVATCGYCQIYLTPEDSYRCTGCVLSQSELCRGGMENAYSSVTNYKYNQSFRPEALTGAKAILAAIEKDIAEDKEKS